MTLWEIIFKLFLFETSIHLTQSWNVLLCFLCWSEIQNGCHYRHKRK